MIEQRKLNIIYYMIMLIELAIIIYLLLYRQCDILEKYRWTIPRPPSIKDRIVVYVSSGLFNLYEVMYSIGIKNLADTSAAASVFSDHIPTIYEQAKMATASDDFLSMKGQANFIINTMIPQILHIPENGMAGELAKSEPSKYLKTNGWGSYIPARDGFNMAYFLGASSNVTLSDIQKTFPKMTADLWANRGVSLLEAVYGFDMYNLISRCNVCIFNGNGIAMDDGSCVELGICTTRGYPCVIHRDQTTSNFPNGVINPMVAGAAGYQLGGGTLTHPDISSSIDFMDAVLKSITSKTDQQTDYARYIPPPKLVSYWCNVGEAVWQWKYTADPAHYVIEKDGTLNQNSFSSEFQQYITKIGGDLGKALVVAKIIFLIQDVKIKYGIIEQPKLLTHMTRTMSEQKLSSIKLPKDSPFSFANTMARIYNNSTFV